MRYDYAIIVLNSKENLEEYFGSLSYDFSWQEDTNHKNRMQFFSKEIKELMLMGYTFPVAKEKPIFSEYEFSGISDSNYLLYNVLTGPGSSGSPIVSQTSKGDLIVRAIHARGLKKVLDDVQGKGGLKLRSDMLQGINHFMNRPLPYRPKQIDSKILDDPKVGTYEQQEQFILNAFKDRHDFNLLYRASEHDFSASTFHKKCD